MNEFWRRNEKWIDRWLLLTGSCGWWLYRACGDRISPEWCLAIAHVLAFAAVTAIVVRVTLRAGAWLLAGLIGFELCLGAFVAVSVLAITWHTPPAKRATCVSNLKQLDLALQQYADDHDGLLPPVSVDWAGALHNCLAYDSCLHCPADNHEVSYRLNPYLQGRNLTDLPDAVRSRTVLVYCADRLGLSDRHGGDPLVGFCDGHVVAWRQGNEVWNPWAPAAGP